MSRLFTVVCLAAGVLGGMPAWAEIPDNTVKVGVLTDMTGPFADQGGPGSVVAAKMAAEDFAPESKGLKVEILAADHQNKPDIGVAIAAKWVDQDGVDAVVDLPNSGVALAVDGVMKDKHRVSLASSSMSSAITGKACSATTVQWVSDTWAQGASTVAAMHKAGANTWYFITVDYALGQALEGDATTALVAAGDKALGSTRLPLGTTDFGSALLAAQGSGAKVLALANTGADAINAVKQAGEFGLTKGGVKLAALFMMLSDIQSIGLPAAHGLQLTEAFYWDLNDNTRAWSKRWSERMNGRMPTQDQAGVYSATLAYLRAVRDSQTIVGEQVVAAMGKAPIEDKLFGSVTIRPDGRAVHDMYLFQVKTPAESKGPWDLYTMEQTIPGAAVFRPLNAGGCPLVKTQ
ncbi:MAG: branched-chain amino acid transport system substrate-binding protein [Acetobacteraceae bacterium]|nr:branched-chain amino acid transport system substrate-binding protein [Acetobacteraceae bacterium]